MTNAPADLLAHRSVMAGITGLTDPNDLGIVGDGAHRRTGGYHEGKDVLVDIGRYHPPATSNVGAAAEDYSARLARDRNGLTLNASAMDYGDNWPKGGRAAWLRFNNRLVAALHANAAALAAVRAVNYSPDGVQRLRTDRQAGWKVIPSTDSVTIHTHVEFYRDTAGRRQATFDGIANLARAAIANKPDSVPVQPSQKDDEDMGMLAKPNNGDNIYHCIGGFSHLLTTPAQVDDVRHLARQGAYTLATRGPNDDPNEWSPDGTIRMGWYPGGAFGPVWSDSTSVDLTEEDLDDLASKITAGIKFPNYKPESSAS